MNRNLLVARVSATLALGCFTFGSVNAAQSKRAEELVSAEQAIACIKAAVAERQGRVKELEIDVERGRTICEVEVIDANGRKFEVHVDVAANKVVKVDD